MNFRFSVVIKNNVELRRCIVDKQVVVPPGERIGFDAVRDAERFTFSPGGVVVIPKGYRFEG